MGETHIKADGTLEGPPTFGNTNLALRGKIKNLATLNSLFNTELPNLPAELTFQLVEKNQLIILEGFYGTLGDSDISGTASMTVADRPHLTVHLTSSFFDVTPHMPPREASPAPTKNSNTVTPARRNERKKSAARVIPDRDVSIAALQKFTAEFDLTVESLKIEAHTVSNAALKGVVEDGALIVTEVGFKTPRGGRLDGSFAARPAGAGTHLASRLEGSELSIGLPAESEEELRGLPKYDLKLALVAEGKNMRDIAASLDGYVRLESGRGRLRTGELRGFTNDFGTELLETINPFIESSPYTKLKCATLLAVSRQGQISGSPAFLMQSDSLKTKVDLKADLATEALAVSFQMVPQKGLGFSLSGLINPYVMVTGTMANPILSIDPEAALVQGGVAVATGGLSILALGLKDRFFSSKDPCGQALLDADKKMQALEDKFAR
jgi:hypothetical protein